MTFAPAAGRTIFALSSGALPAAIAVVRVSGPDAGTALRALAGRLPSPRRATLAALRLSSDDGPPLDDALVLWMPGPSTVTGEDLAELHLHGGRATVAAVLAALATFPGLTPAGPGAFTRRAFANGRIDLAEAEGLADLLAAETDAQRRAALRLAEGGLGRLVAGWRRQLIDLSAHVEAAIEFAEEHDDVEPSLTGVIDGAGRVRVEIGTALAKPPAERLRDGLRIVVAGPVNEGKSSLLNALAGRSAAITTSVPGTTRDLIEVPVVLDGIACILIDTAGLRASDDPVERKGIERAEAAIASADLLLWLGNPEDVPPAPHRLIVRSRVDLPGRLSGAPEIDCEVSAKTGIGLVDLRKKITQVAHSLLPAEGGVALNARHRAELLVACNLLASLPNDIILLAEHLRAARNAVERLTGHSGTEAMLDALFSRFCVGK